MRFRELLHQLGGNILLFFVFCVRNGEPGNKFHKRYLIKSMTFRWSMLYCDLVMITVASSQPNASIFSPISPKENIYYTIPMSIDRDGQGKCHFLSREAVSPGHVDLSNL